MNGTSRFASLVIITSLLAPPGAAMYMDSGAGLAPLTVSPREGTPVVSWEITVVLHTSGRPAHIYCADGLEAVRVTCAAVNAAFRLMWAARNAPARLAAQSAEITPREVPLAFLSDFFDEAGEVDLIAPVLVDEEIVIHMRFESNGLDGASTILCVQHACESRTIAPVDATDVALPVAIAFALASFSTSPEPIELSGASEAVASAWPAYASADASEAVPEKTEAPTTRFVDVALESQGPAPSAPRAIDARESDAGEATLGATNPVPVIREATEAGTVPTFEGAGARSAFAASGTWGSTAAAFSARTREAGDSNERVAAAGPASGAEAPLGSAFSAVSTASLDAGVPVANPSPRPSAVAAEPPEDARAQKATGSLPSVPFGSGPVRLFALLALLAAVLAAPFFSRVSRERLVDHEKRRAVYDLIQADPGRTLQEISQRLGLHVGLVTYHVQILKRGGLVLSRRARRRERYFVPGSTVDVLAADVVATSTAQRIVAHVSGSPGSSIAEISAASRLSGPLVAYHARHLVKAGVLAVEVEGRRSRFRIANASGAKAQGVP